MTYFDDLLETQNQADVEYIPLVEETDDAIEPKLNDGDVLGVLPLRNMVLFPGVLLPVTVGRPKSKKLVATAFKNDQLLAVCCQKVQDVQEPSSEDLYPIGTAGRVMRTLDMPDGNLMVILEGVQRIYIEEIVGVRPYMKAKVQTMPEDFPKRNDKEFVALVSSLKNVAEKIIKSMENLPAEAGMTLKSIDNPPTLVNYICGNFGMQIADKQQLLEISSLRDRANALLEVLNKEMLMLEMRKDIQKKTKEDLDREQREHQDGQCEEDDRPAVDGELVAVDRPTEGHTVEAVAEDEGEDAQRVGGSLLVRELFQQGRVILQVRVRRGAGAVSVPEEQVAEPAIGQGRDDELHGAVRETASRKLEEGVGAGTQLTRVRPGEGHVDAVPDEHRKRDAVGEEHRRAQQLQVKAFPGPFRPAEADIDRQRHQFEHPEGDDQNSHEKFLLTRYFHKILYHVHEPLAMP